MSRNGTPRVAPLRRGDPQHLAGYQIVGRLGEGGQGSVFLAHAPGGERVAMKVLHARFGADPIARARFVREVDAARRVAGFCTARVLAADLDGDVPYIVSEFIDGPSLWDHLNRHGPQDGGALERLAIGTLTALAAIHQAGIVHRDFKPANVLLSPEGPRVVDFGIARVLDATSTLTSQAVGTPAYMAPEQFDGGPATPATDLFAWGATMAHAATGCPPFGAGSVAAVVGSILDGEPDLDGLGGPLRPIVASCLAKDPAGRSTSADLLGRLLTTTPAFADPADRTRADATEVLKLLHPHPVAQKPAAPTAPDQPAPGTDTTVRRDRRAVLAAGALAVIGGLAAVPFLLRGHRGSERLQWKQKIHGNQVVRMIMIGDVIVLTLESGPLYALEATTGRRLWARDGAYTDLVHSAQGLFAASADRVERIDVGSGRPIWSVPGAAGRVTTGGGLVITSTPERIQGGMPAYQVTVTALTPDGRRRWARTIADPSGWVDDAALLAASPRLVGVTAGKTVYALATATGKILWQFPLGAHTERAPGVLAEDTILIGSRDDKAPLYALDKTTGKPRWQHTVAADSGDGNWLSLAADTQSAYVINYGIVALDIRTGRERWRFDQGNPGDTWGPFGGVLYATPDLLAFDPATGKLLWSQDSLWTETEGVPTAVTVDDSTVFVAVGAHDSKNQTIFALHAR